VIIADCITLTVACTTCKSQLDEVEWMSDERGDDSTRQPGYQVFVSDSREKRLQRELLDLNPSISHDFYLGRMG